MNNHDEIGGGLFGAVLITTLVLICLFGYAPISYYLGKWNDHWKDNIGKVSYPTGSNYIDRSAYKFAQQDCEKRTKDYFGVPKIETLVLASSTTDHYATYDCYGVRLTKIPK